MTILERTKSYLEENKMSQIELAELSGVHFVALSRFLNGKYKDGTVLRLDKFLSEHEKPKAIKELMEQENRP